VAAIALLGLLALAANAAAAPVQPNDPAWPDQWAQKLIRLPDVWNITTGDPGIVVATIDTGVNPLPDLADSLVGGWDFVDNDPVPEDTNGHGTQVASVIAARGNNAIGMAGHCWQCRIMPIRVSAGGSVNPHLIASGIMYAVDHGARVIDISLTRPGSPHWAEEGAVRYALDRGVVVVASAGNNGTDAPQYPGAYPGVLAVGASDDADELYFWSSFGSWVALSAPGCHLVLNPFAGTLCGTSFTPAAVAGVAGLMLSRNPGLTRHQIATALAATATPVRGVAFGRINALAAFEFLGLLPPAQAQGGTGATPPATSTTTPRPRTPAPGQRFTRQKRFETGSFRRGFRATWRIGRGRFEAHLLTPLARDCTLSLRTPGDFFVASPAVRNLLSLAVSALPAGRYTLDVRCRGARDRQYSLGVIAMFPRGGRS
jgi:subtilisin family serine protease